MNWSVTNAVSGLRSLGQGTPVFEKLGALKERFPGAILSGCPAPDAVGKNVQILRGARVHFTAGLRLKGHTIIRPEAVVQNNMFGDPWMTIDGSDVAGSVYGGLIEGCHIHAGASAKGVVHLRGSVFEKGVEINGGTRSHSVPLSIRNSYLFSYSRADSGRTVGTTIRNSIVGEESRVSAGAEVIGSTLGYRCQVDGRVECSDLGANQRVAERLAVCEAGPRPVVLADRWNALNYEEQVKRGRAGILLAQRQPSTIPSQKFKPRALHDRESYLRLVDLYEKWVPPEHVRYRRRQDAEDQRLTQLRSLYPGAHLLGRPGPKAVGADVQIKPGAEVYFTQGTQLSGKTVIQAGASVFGGSRIHNSDVGGSVYDSAVKTCFVAPSAEVRGEGSIVEDCVLEPFVIILEAHASNSYFASGSKATRASVTDSSIGAHVQLMDGARVRNSDVGEGSRIYGTATHVTIPPKTMVYRGEKAAGSGGPPKGWRARTIPVPQAVLDLEPAERAEREAKKRTES